MLRWTHSPQYLLQGMGSTLHLRIPLFCMQKGELLHIKSTPSKRKKKEGAG